MDPAGMVKEKKQEMVVKMDKEEKKQITRTMMGWKPRLVAEPMETVSMRKEIGPFVAILMVEREDIPNLQIIPPYEEVGVLVEVAQQNFMIKEALAVVATPVVVVVVKEVTVAVAAAG